MVSDAWPTGLSASPAHDQARPWDGQWRDPALHPAQPTHFQYDDQGRLSWIEYRHGSTLERRDGPAVINFDPETGAVVAEEWFHNGQRHRDDGPAVEYADGPVDTGRTASACPPRAAQQRPKVRPLTG